MSRRANAGFFATIGLAFDFRIWYSSSQNTEGNYGQMQANVNTIILASADHRLWFVVGMHARERMQDSRTQAH